MNGEHLVGARGKRVVAFGGGHGLYATLSALRYLTSNITAIVTVADDGGSSGRLRKELGIIPPGDLRMALSALCDDGEWGQTWRDALQYRFKSEGELGGHALGNLLIAGLWDLLGDPVDGLDWVGRLLGIRGRVVPMAAVPLEIEAEVVCDDGSSMLVRGQKEVATIDQHIVRTRLIPEDPPVLEQALAAIADAEMIVFGPGSWYTSVLPHLQVPQLRDAIEKSGARCVLVMNLHADAETTRLSAADHLELFHEYAPNIRLDTIVVDSGAIQEWDRLYEIAGRHGEYVVKHRVENPRKPGYHDPLDLAAALRRAFYGDTVE